MPTVPAHPRRGAPGGAVLALQTWGAGGSPACRRRKQAAKVVSSRCRTSCTTCAWCSRYSGRTSLMALNGRQVRRVHGTAHRDAALFPGGCALLQSGVGELAAAPQDRRQRPFLLGRWQQLVCEGLADGVALLVHSHRFCLTGDKPAPSGTVVARASWRATRLASPWLQARALSQVLW